MWKVKSQYSDFNQREIHKCNISNHKQAGQKYENHQRRATTIQGQSGVNINRIMSQGISETMELVTMDVDDTVLT